MSSNENINGSNLEHYIPATIGPYTHRKISEIDGQKIDFSNAHSATREMKRRIDNVFGSFSEVGFSMIDWSDPVISYTEAVNRISEDTIIVDKKLSLEDYLKVDTARYPKAIKERIRSIHETGSIPVVYLDLIDRCERFLNISGQESAILTMRLITVLFPTLASTANELKKHTSEEEASRAAFRTALKFMDTHIEDIQVVQNALDLTTTKAQSLVLNKMVRNTKNKDHEAEIIISVTDKDGLVEASHIQDRPYSEEELKVAEKLLASNKYIAKTIIIFQQLLAQHAIEYFFSHPQRLNENLEPYNSIFIPVKGNTGAIESFSPNPKLLRTICNNWLPSIARQFLVEGGKSITNYENLTADQISKAIEETRGYDIFNNIIGEFVATDNPKLISWRGAFSQVCPAKNMIIQSGKTLIPDIYTYITGLNLK